MDKPSPITVRKNDHIRINLTEDVQSSISTGLEKYQFIHNAIPELDLGSISLEQNVFQKTLNAPILISSMTGGTQEAKEINRILASAAQATGIALGVGSQRAGIDDPSQAHTFQVRTVAPDILLFANLGAVQLNYGYSVDECQRAVDMIDADALILHFNALQEAVQQEGDTNFSNLLGKIEDVCRNLSVPVIAKEVGWGFSKTNAKQLADVGISAIDVAGAGGTSWTQVEMHRTKIPSQRKLAAAFIDWGIPTVESIHNVKEIAPDLLVFASGGLRSGIDIAKCVALGANLGGMAGPFLKAASSSLDDTITVITELISEIHVCMFAAGAANITQLQETPLKKI